MNALPLATHLPLALDEAKNHLEILADLLRDVDLESRMMTLIKVQEFIKEEEFNQIELQSIRNDLEVEFQKIRKMIFMVEKAQFAIT